MSLTEHDLAFIDKKIAEQIEPLKKEIQENEHFMYGILTTLMELMPPLLKSNPELAQKLEPRFRYHAQKFANLQSGQSDEFDDTPDRHEPAKMLYKYLELLDTWKQPD